jgi:hypothetical protein
MSNTLPKDMRPRKARPLDVEETREGWWYVDPSRITVHAVAVDGNYTAVSLTKSQLLRALAIMEAHDD